MIVTHRSDRVEPLEIVFVRRVISVPRNDIERRMINARRPQVSREFCDEFEVALTVFVPGDRSEKVARIR